MKNPSSRSEDKYTFMYVSLYGHLLNFAVKADNRLEFQSLDINSRGREEVSETRGLGTHHRVNRKEALPLRSGVRIVAYVNQQNRNPLVASLGQSIGAVVAVLQNVPSVVLCDTNLLQPASEGEAYEA